MLIQRSLISFDFLFNFEWLNIWWKEVFFYSLLIVFTFFPCLWISDSKSRNEKWKEEIFFWMKIGVLFYIFSQSSWSQWQNVSRWMVFLWLWRDFMKHFPKKNFLLSFRKLIKCTNFPFHPLSISHTEIMKENNRKSWMCT